MSAGSDHLPLTLRYEPSHQRYGFAAMFAAFGGLVLVGAFTSSLPSDRSTAARWLFAAFVLGSVVLAWRTLGLSLRVEEERVVVRNFFWTHRVGWDKITGMHDASTRDEGGDHKVIAIARRGRKQWVLVTASGGQPERLLAIVRSTARQHGVNADFTIR